MKILLLTLLIFSGCFFPLNAEDLRIGISWEKIGINTKTFSSFAAGNAKESLYRIIVANNSFKDLPAIEVEYTIFINRQKSGTTKDQDQVDYVRESKKIEAIKAQQKAIIETKPFKIHESHLGARWEYINGGRRDAKDTLKGVWVRVYKDGSLVAEYANPPGIKQQPILGR